MAEIHQTAIIDPSVKLGKDVSVGAYTIIEKDVSIGVGTWIGPHVVIRNHTDIGANKNSNRFSDCLIW